MQTAVVVQLAVVAKKADMQAILKRTQLQDMFVVIGFTFVCLLANYMPIYIYVDVYTYLYMYIHIFIHCYLHALLM